MKTRRRYAATLGIILLFGILRLPLESRLARTAKEHPTWMIVAAGMPAEALLAHEKVGIDIIRIGHDPEDERLDLALALTALAERGITRLLVEGGAVLAASLLRAKLVDRLVVFQAPMMLGGDGVPAVAALSLELAQKVVAGTVDEAAQRALVDRYIDDLGGLEG